MANDSLDKYHRQFEMDDAVCASLLLGFKRKIIHDCTMPSPYYLVERLNKKLPELKIGKSLKTKILRVIHREDRDSESHFERFMKDTYNILIWEWYYMWGDVFAWKPRQKAEAIRRMKKNLTEKEKKDMYKVWKILRTQRTKETGYWWDDQKQV